MTENQKVIIVDDEPTNLLLLSAVLKKIEGDFQILQAKNGKEALDLMDNNEFALAILDIQMPIMDGYTLASKMQEHPKAKSTPIIFLTAIFNDDEHINKGYGAGAVDFIGKPFNKTILQQKARVFLKLDSQRKELELINKKLEYEITERKKTEEKLQVANQKLEELATTDSLTGLNNVRSFRAHLRKELERSHRNSTFTSILLLDVDKFKPFNDTYGHPAGDKALQDVAAILKETARDLDFVARYGGEEFVIILPNTNDELAKQAAERIRKAIANHPWEVREITVNIGISTVISATMTPEELIEQADQALYFSKENGRNRSTHFSQIPKK
jgi:diguanylate cyclase (GGDEF)-like protein